MNANKKIVAVTLVITGVGILHAWTANPPQGITPVVIGGYLLMLLWSVFDLFGGGLAQTATALAMLTLVAVLLLEGLPILQQVGILTGGSKPAKPATPAKNTPPGTTPGGHISPK